MGFQLIVQTADEELGLELTLPGIPPIPLLGMPGIRIPRMEAQEIPLRLRQQPGVRGYVGNVYPVGQGGKGVGGKFEFPGFKGFEVEGIPNSMLPGISPSTYTMDWLNRNYQIIAEVLATEGITFEPVPIPHVDICAGGTQGGQGPGGTSPGVVLVTELVNQMNQQITTALAGCITSNLDTVSAFNDTACWTETVTPNSSISTSGDGSLVTFNFTAGGVSGVLRNHRSPLAAEEPVRACTAKPCAHAWRVTYLWSGNATVSPDDIVQRVIAYSLDPLTSARTQIQSNTHTIPVGNTASGIDEIIVAAGIVPEGHHIGLQVDWNVSSGAGSGFGLFQDVTIVDDGP